MRVRALSHLFRIARVCSDRRRRHPSQPIGFKFFFIPPSFFSLLFFPLSFLSTNEKSEKAELGGGKFKKQNKIKQEDMIPSHFFSTRPGQPMSIMKSQPSCSTGGGISNKYRNKLKLFVWRSCCYFLTGWQPFIFNGKRGGDAIDFFVSVASPSPSSSSFRCVSSLRESLLRPHESLKRACTGRDWTHEESRQRKKKEKKKVLVLAGWLLDSGRYSLPSLSLSLRHHLLKGISQVNVWRIYNVSPQLKSQESFSSLSLFSLAGEDTHERERESHPQCMKCE